MIETYNRLTISTGVINLACFDCEVPLDLINSWEPCARLDTQTGDLLHVPICASCIAHLDEVYEHDVLRVVFKLAKRYRRRGEYQKASKLGYASVANMRLLRDPY